MCIRDRVTVSLGEQTVKLPDFVGMTLNDATIPVSYTHLDVYKRQVEALRDDLCVCAFTFIVVADCIEKLPENVEYADVYKRQGSNILEII